MATKFELNAELRHDLGKGASRRLRRADKVPAIIYGAEAAPTPLLLDHNELIHALRNEAFYSHILTINLAGQPQQAVLKDLQRHPSKRRVTHVDLMRVTGKEKINMHVPLHFKGEEAAPGVKQDGGIVVHQLTTVEVRCLPADLPEYIEVDLSNLALHQIIHLADLALPKGVELVALLHEDNAAVATIHLPRAAVVEEDLTGAPVAPEAPEAIKQSAESKEEPAADKEKGKK